MNALITLSIIVGLVGTTAGVYFGARALRSANAADKRANAAAEQAVRDKTAQEVSEARRDEQRLCGERLAPVMADLAEMTRDRDYQRSRADGLQTLINEGRGKS